MFGLPMYEFTDERVSLTAGQRWQVADWHNLIYQCGYYDQSHFIREFTQFTGKRPSLYVKDNLELTHYPA